MVSGNGLATSKVNFPSESEFVLRFVSLIKIVAPCNGVF